MPAFVYHHMPTSPDTKTPEPPYRFLYEWGQQADLILQKVRRALTIPDIFSTLVEAVGRFLQVDYCLIVEFKSMEVQRFDQNICEPILYEYRKDPSLPSFQGPLDPRINRYPYRDEAAAIGKDFVVVNDLEDEGETVFFKKDWRAYFLEHHIRGYIGSSIYYQDKAFAGLMLFNRQPRQWRAQELSFLRSITEQVAIAVFQAKVIEELEKTTQMKASFLANISHELRTPLNAIIGFSELLQGQQVGALTPQQNKYVDHVIHSGHHLLNIVNDLLDLSRIEAGYLDLHIEKIDLPSLMVEVIETVQEAAIAKQIRIYPTLKPVNLYTDPQRLKQILLNLLTNAVKFNKQNGSVFIKVYTTADQHHARFEIEDTGIGIPQAEIPNLFKDFYQVDSSLARRQEGTGLGLALTKRLLEALRGSIQIRSEVDVGSVFTFELPFAY